MPIWGKRSGESRAAPVDVAERFVSVGLLRSSRETADLGDRATVTRWLRELVHADDQQVLVHRPWGTVAAVAEGGHPPAVVRSDGENSWFATEPGAPDDRSLTPDQVEHVVLDALTSAQAPAWPDWHALT